MKKFALGLAVAGLALGSAGALYAAAPAPSEGAHPRWDGTLTWAQAQAHADAIWAKLDVNKDGKLDQADREAAELKRFDAMDANHDGMISRAEFLVHAQARHDAMKKHMADMPPMGGMKDGMKDDAGGARPRGMMGHHGMGGMAALHMLGLKPDKDGVITRATYDAAVKARFDKADTNHDGTLTRDEMRAAMPRPPFGGKGPGGWGQGGRGPGGWGGHGGAGKMDGPMADMPPADDDGN